MLLERLGQFLGARCPSSPASGETVIASWLAGTATLRSRRISRGSGITQRTQRCASSLDSGPDARRRAAAPWAGSPAKEAGVVAAEDRQDDQTFHGKALLWNQ